MLADAEIYRPVELGWLAMLARFAIWDLTSEGTFHDEENTKSSSILGHLLDLREVRVLPLCPPCILKSTISDASS